MIRLAAFALGVLVGWMVRGRQEEDAIDNALLRASKARRRPLDTYTTLADPYTEQLAAILEREK